MDSLDNSQIISEELIRTLLAEIHDASSIRELLADFLAAKKSDQQVAPFIVWFFHRDTQTFVVTSQI